MAQVTILALSELGWFAHFFGRFFPLVGPEFGPGPLGVFQCLIGGTVLSHHVPKFTLASGFFLFSTGCLNIVIGVILGVAAKTIRSGGMQESDYPDFQRPAPCRRRSSVVCEGATPGLSGSPGFGFGKQAEKAVSMKGIICLHHRPFFNQSLICHLSPGIPLPQSPPPLPTYSPPRPPNLKPRNVSSTS